MNDQIKECIKVVETLNAEWYEKTKDEENIPFVFKVADWWMEIDYFCFNVWDNEDNDCPYIDNSNKQVPLIEHVRKNVKEINEMIKKFDRILK